MIMMMIDDALFRHRSQLCVSVYQSEGWFWFGIWHCFDGEDDYDGDDDDYDDDDDDEDADNDDNDNDDDALFR